MSNGLEPCPFCGGHSVKEFDSDWGLIVRCLECPAIMTESPYLGVLDPIEAWNRRAERTCGMRSRFTGMYCYECTECGNGIKPDWNYCPNCGAKVED